MNIFVAMKNETYMHIGRAIEKYHPDMLEEVLPKVQVPVPSFKHLHLLPALLDAFCELKQVSKSVVFGVNKGADSIASHDHKKQFVAAILVLYNPEALTGVHMDKIKGGVCSEAAALLGCAREQVSQYASEIKSIFNHTKPIKYFMEYQAEIEKLAALLKNSISQMDVSSGNADEAAEIFAPEC